MTTVASLEWITGLVSDPVMKKTASITFGRCGNCLRRVKCSSRLLNIKLGYQLVAADAVKPREPSRYAREAAKIFKGKCGVCDQIGVCINIWAARNGCDDQALAVRIQLQALAKKDIGEIAAYLEGLMKAMGIKPGKLLLSMANLWLKCQRDGSYVTGVMVCGGKLNARHK